MAKNDPKTATNPPADDPKIGDGAAQNGDANAGAGEDGDAAPAAAPEKVELPPADGKPRRMKAVHGDIYHPFTKHKFTVAAEDKQPFDSWCRIQMEAGKLAFAED